MKIQSDRISFYIKLVTIEIYWPKIIYNNSDIGVFLHSQISCKKSTKWNDWLLDWAFVLKILGFGVGVAYKHCDNPNLTKQTNTKPIRGEV